MSVFEYFPFDGKPHRWTMGIRNLNPEEWFQIGEDYSEQIQERRRLLETRHDEVYNFRFKPEGGFGMQLLEPDEDRLGEAFHIVDGSSFAIKSGYHPCVVAPGYEMYYFTILGGLSQRSLVQYFQPEHAWQIETIPGIKDMIAKFK